VDAFLEAHKIAVGIANWQEGNRPSLLKISWSLQIGGVSSGGRLTIEASIRAPDPTFSAVLIFAERAIARLDYDHTDVHYNPWDAPGELPKGKIVGVHAHLWADNRAHVPSNGLPKKLPVARPIPAERVSDFDWAMAWFLDVCNIHLDMVDIPTLPMQGRLW
jgi:hypothetical protein